MLGDIDTRLVHLAEPKARVYPSRANVTEIIVSEKSGRNLTRLNFSAVTRFILILQSTADTFVFDTSTQPGVVTGDATGRLVFDLNEYAMPESEYQVALIAYDAEHAEGQVILDGKLDSNATLSIRTVLSTGTNPPPSVEFVTEAPIDGELYGRQNGVWVSISEVVAGVLSVNGQTGIVVLDAAGVGADPAGTGAAQAAAAVAAHEADITPHAVLTGVDRIAFDQTAAISVGVAELAWNATDATLDLGLPGGSVLQVGQEFLIRGRNTSGTTMVDGTVVYVSGAQGFRPVFARAQANQSTADKTIGVITQDIANNTDGFCTLAGLVRDFDTSAWAEGTELWLSASVSGGLTSTKPAPPNNAVRVGQVIRSHATLGQILVRVQIIEAVRELHDVNIIAPQDGDILEYDSSTATWINTPNTGGSGEANTASNLGSGNGVFAQKVGADLQFKSLVAGSGITLTPTANTITITGSGGGGAVDSVNGQTGVVVLDTDDINEGATNLYFTNGRAAAAAPVQSVDGQTGAVSLSASYAPLSHVGDTGAAHGNASTSVAGFMSGADKAKLDGIASGAQVNVPTNLTSTPGASTVVIASSTGDDATVLAATGSAAGVMTAADKTKLDAAEYQLVAGTNVTIDRTNPTAPVISASGGGGAMPGAGYAQYLAASLEPDAIETLNKGAFSYVVGPSETKLLTVSWATRIGATGRMEQRNPQRPLPLRGVTLNGISAGSGAIVIDPSLPVYADPWETYYERLQAIAESPVRTIPFTATNQKLPFLTGAYGAIIVQYTCFDFAWIALRPIGGSTVGVNLWDEISDSATQRIGNSLSLAVNKKCAAELHSSSTGSSPSGSVSFVLVPSTWSVIADPLTYTFRDDFMGSALDTGVWTRVQSTAGNVEIATLYQWLALFGNSTWGANGLYRTATEARATGKVMLVDFYVPQNAAVNGAAMVGWSDGLGHSFSNFAHGVNFAAVNVINIFENGTGRGTVGSGYTLGAIYRIRITLNISGAATYEIQGGPEYQPLGGNTWTNITPGTTSSATNTLTPGATGFAGNSYISDIRVY